jgi:hypothetical protein
MPSAVVEPLLEIILWHGLVKRVQKITAPLNVCAQDTYFVHIVMSNWFISMYS